MSDKEENRTFQLECIDLYKRLPALWKVKSEDYSNRNKKDAAYAVLIEKFQEKYPNYTREDVKKKINSYGTNYRKELKKVQDSERSGAGTDQLYEPTL
ncbi:transcription factor adf-1 [Plakobranchus ocellatus]|uniref:Transcription factor adf-1 n=1 Tax=Plakobranchus ocellatus TaxID=259542 RepID=A0AAV3Z060_9GAST|nr:transcription factor adf-1 [Plakobranchus ocellatus]